MIERVFLLSLIICKAALPSLAQKGSAMPGFYPSNYHGETFTGKVVESESDKLSLEYRHGSKQEVFVGVTESACMAETKNRGVKELHLSAIPKGTVLTAFYNHKTMKDGTVKREFNSILAIRFDEMNGEKLTNPDRPIIPCSKGAPGMNAY
jgi:hypothetical protein